MSVSELLLQDPARAVAEAEAAVAAAPDDLETLQVLAEVHFELGNAQQAYDILEKCAEMDPDGTKGGFEKFLWLGQLTGGRQGIEWYTKGVEGLRSINANDKIITALLGMIEIWMTDLCMEPEAESMCERLIADALLLDELAAETWSILGSIRISQVRNDDARTALEKSWDLYNAQLDHVVQPTVIPSLLRLGQSMIEMEMYDLVLDVTSKLARLDDQIPDVYYLNALAHQTALAKSDNEQDSARHNVAIRDAVELMAQLPDVDPEMLQAGHDLVESLPELTVDVPDSDEEDMEELQ